MTRKKVNDFIILGPTLHPNTGVLEAIHSLYYLPENYKLIFTGTSPIDPRFYKDMIKLVERDDLGDRVQFITNPRVTHAIILPHRTKTRAKYSVSGDSAEALASAILTVARSAGHL